MGDQSMKNHVFPDPSKLLELVEALETAARKVAGLPPKSATRTLAVSVNPKDRFGDLKPKLSLVPASSIIYQALAMQDGAEKYGPYNFREKPVKASIYVDACMRHLLQWFDGETEARDSKKPHLGHALACLGILVDAIETGNLIDDRPVKGAAPDLIEKWTKAKPEST